MTPLLDGVSMINSTVSQGTAKSFHDHSANNTSVIYEWRPYAARSTHVIRAIINSTLLLQSRTLSCASHGRAKSVHVHSIDSHGGDYVA